MQKLAILMHTIEVIGAASTQIQELRQKKNYFPGGAMNDIEQKKKKKRKEMESSGLASLPSKAVMYKIIKAEQVLKKSGQESAT